MAWLKTINFFGISLTKGPLEQVLLISQTELSLNRSQNKDSFETVRRERILESVIPSCLVSPTHLDPSKLSPSSPPEAPARAGPAPYPHVTRK